MNLWLTLFGECIVDKHIREGKLLMEDEVIWILETAIKIHRDYLGYTWDTAATGTDEQHRAAIKWYQDIEAFVQGKIVGVTVEGIIAYLEADVATHQFYIDNPGYITGTIGSVAHQVKWRGRWMAVIRYVLAMA